MAIRIAEEGAHVGNPLPWRDKTDAIARLEQDVVAGEKVEVAAPNPSHHRAEALLQVEISQPAGED